MKKQYLFLVVLAFAFLLLSESDVWAKDKPHNDEVTALLKNFKNYRYGRINLWEVISKDELKEFYKSKSSAGRSETTTTDASEQEYNGWDPAAKAIVENGVKEGKSIEEIRDNLQSEGFRKYTGKTLDNIYDVLRKRMETSQNKKELRAFVITTIPVEPGKDPEYIIGTIFTEVKFEELSADLDEILNNVSEDQVFSYQVMKDEPLDVNKYGKANLYDLIKSYFDQRNLKDKTLEARGLFSNKYYSSQAGSAHSIISSDSIRNQDVETFKKITEGQPENYFKTNEVIVGYDLIRYTRYQDPVYKADVQYKLDSAGNPTTETYEVKTLDVNNPTNKYLPMYGFELRYGIDDINYPSLWSERMTFSALWKSVKLGYILPTSGWSSLSNSMFSLDRKFTYSKGGGVAGSIDIPVPVIKQSSIFQASLGILLGDASPASYKTRNSDPYNYVYNPFDMDYLIRANGQLHYTIGVNIDGNYWFRVGIGGTFYNVESWAYDTTTSSEGDLKLNFKKKESKSIGGISGRIDFMVNNISTPIGARLQYFDNAVSANFWLQVPIVERTLSLRFDISGYTVAFRQNIYAWENSSLFMPSVKLIYIF
jgi:hypothetical protein